MIYDYKYDVNEFGVVVLKDLPFENRYVEVPREEQFRQLYSYVLIDIDLFYAIRFLELCSETDNDIERQCFFRMAVIQYAKCFSPSKKGGRSPLNPATIYRDLSNDSIGCHNKFIEMRNKYFAHDEMDFKTSKLGAVLNMDSHKVMGIAYPKMQTKFDYNENINILKTLCQKTKDWVSSGLENEIERIGEYIEQKGFDVLDGYGDLKI